MVKEQVKTLINEKNPLNYTSDTPMEYKSPPKSRKQIYQENYQKNKERKKTQQKERYQQQKQQSQLTTQQSWEKYYKASAIKILISFKEYTELNQQKHKLWLDFNWTLKDCQESIKEGFGDIVAIMKLEQVAHKLICDYWATSKQETKKSKSWNSLSEEQQARLIKYWGYEKARMENNYLEEEERLEKQSQEYLKEIELAKFHEQRGKIKCPCHSCAEKQVLKKAVKTKINKELKELEKQETNNKRGKCCVCGKVKELEEETGACKKCSGDYDN